MNVNFANSAPASDSPSRTIVVESSQIKLTSGRRCLRGQPAFSLRSFLLFSAALCALFAVVSWELRDAEKQSAVEQQVAATLCSSGFGVTLAPTRNTMLRYMLPHASSRIAFVCIPDVQHLGLPFTELIELLGRCSELRLISGEGDSLLDRSAPVTHQLQTNELQSNFEGALIIINFH